MIENIIDPVWSIDSIDIKILIYKHSITIYKAVKKEIII